MLAAAPPELAQVTNVVHDLDRAVRFHRDVLGLPLLFQAPPSLAFFQMGAVRLCCHRRKLPNRTIPVRCSISG